MFSLKYVGPKPLISHTGIEFEIGKEDKYVYINIALQLYKALKHDYFEEKTFTYDANTKPLSNQEIEAEVHKLCINIDEIVEQHKEEVEQEINHQIARAKESHTLSDEDKEVWINNIKMMHDYLLQREVNKTVYYQIVDCLADLVKQEHIDYIIAPMFQKFAHVLHSVQGVLANQKFPIDTKLEFYEKEGKLFTKLQVINILDEAEPIQVKR